MVVMKKMMRRRRRLVGWRRDQRRRRCRWRDEVHVELVAHWVVVVVAVVAHEHGVLDLRVAVVATLGVVHRRHHRWHHRRHHSATIHIHTLLLLLLQLLLLLLLLLKWRGERRTLLACDNNGYVFIAVVERVVERERVDDVVVVVDSVVEVEAGASDAV